MISNDSQDIPGYPNILQNDDISRCHQQQLKRKNGIKFSPCYKLAFAITLLERELFFCIVFWFQPVPGLPRTSIAFRGQNPASPLATAIPPHCVSVRSEHLK